MAKKEKNKKPNKWLYIIFFTIPIIFCLLLTTQFDNDLWYLLSEGRYIVQNGIYNIDPLSMHEGLSVVVQNWASASLLWILYSCLGQFGILSFILITNFFICLLIYKICSLISEKNYLLSLIIMFCADVTLLSHFVVSRPQMISFIILLGVIYVLELYIKTEKSKYLIWLPILSFLEVNLHASLWWMIFLFTLPYVIDSFKSSLLKTQGFKKKPLFIAIAIALLVGLLNPYGYKAITFIFSSYGDQYMHLYINELLPFTFNKQLSKHMFMLMLAIGLIYAFFRDGKIRVRYLCLFSGTLLLGFMSVKGFSHFILVSLFPLAYFFKDLFPKDFSEITDMFPKLIKYSAMSLGILCICSTGALFTYRLTTNMMENKAKDAMDLIAQVFDPQKVNVYSSFNDGGYVSFRGYKPYIDPRAELYLKKNNKKADIFKEFYDLQHDKYDKQTFLNKYAFDILLVSKHDKLYNEMETLEGYFIVYDSYEYGYRIYLNNNLYSEEKRQEIIDAYNADLEKAKQEQQKNTGK